MYETVFKFARLMLCAHEDRAAVQALAFELQALDLFTNAPRLLRPVPHAYDFDFLALVDLGPECLAKAAAVGVDQAAGGGEDMRGRAVILFELDDFCTRKILFKAQDIGHLRPAPAVDRLVIIADAGDVLALLREQPQPQILDRIGVLIFVDEDIFELLLIFLEHVAVLAEQRQAVQQQVAKVTGVERQKARLVYAVKMLAFAVGISFVIVGIELGRRFARILPFVDQARQLFSRKAFVVDIF